VAGGIGSLWLAVAFVSLAAAAHQGWSANIFTTVSDMFPAECVGTVVSFGQVAGAIGGAIFQPIAGHILTLTHSYVLLFAYSGFAYLLALFLLRTLAPGLRRAHLEM
jgi:ACS family hexuronate transporter-like MFS transporter